MKFLPVTLLLLAACSTTQSSFLSPIHQDMDRVCHFNSEANAVRNDLSRLGPALRPQIQTEEVSKILGTLDKEGGDKLVLLAKGFGFKNCDLVEVLKPNSKTASQTDSR